MQFTLVATCSSITIKLKRIRHIDIYTLKYNYYLVQDDIVTYVARCLYVENGRTVDLDLVKSKMSEYFPASYMTSHANSSKARDALARAVVASFDKQGFSGYAVPARYVSILFLPV